MNLGNYLTNKTHLTHQPTSCRRKWNHNALGQLNHPVNAPELALDGTMPLMLLASMPLALAFVPAGDTGVEKLNKGVEDFKALFVYGYNEVLTHLHCLVHAPVVWALELQSNPALLVAASQHHFHPRPIFDPAQILAPDTEDLVPEPEVHQGHV